MVPLSAKMQAGFPDPTAATRLVSNFMALASGSGIDPLAGVDEAAGVGDLAVGEGPAPGAWRLSTESVMRSRLISSSIWAKAKATATATATVTVQTMDPIGVPVSTGPPPKFSTCKLMLRLRSCSDVRPSIFTEDLPNRSKMVITRVSPSSIVSTNALSKAGRETLAPLTRCST